jgi:DNA-binding CsgD family transcriptional regulator
MDGRVIDTAREALGDLDEYLGGGSQRRFARRRTGSLSEGECEVLVLLAEGFTTAEVAEKLFVSEHAVRSRIKSLLGKLDAKTREQAVAIAIRDGAV